MRHRSSPRPGREAGFTLVEALVAFVVVVVMVLGLAATLKIALRNQADVRMHQQAGALAVEGIEFARSLSWNEVFLSGDPEPGDPNVAGDKLENVPFGLDKKETLEIDTVNGLIQPYTATPEIIDGQEFTVRQYVTEVEKDEVRRVVVLVEWDSEGTAQRRHVSTLISRIGAG